ncbi:hypothetical protein [Nocardioides furvisabuli]|nr:hypothetical protein [Nocardioides furvisabuli]
MADWITVREAAQVLGVHISAVPKMIRRGDLTKRAKRPVLDRGEVIAYRNARLAAQEALASERERPQQPKPPDLEHDWLSADAAAAVMGVTRVAVNARARRGRVPSVLSGGRRWYRRDHLELVMRAQAAKRNRVP